MDEDGIHRFVADMFEGLAQIKVPNGKKDKTPLAEMTEEMKSSTDNAIKIIKEARQLGWHSADFSVQTEMIANETERYLLSAPNLTYKRYNLNFEVFWSKDAIFAF